MAVQEAPNGGEPYSRLKKRAYSLLGVRLDRTFRGSDGSVVALSRTGIRERGFIVQITSSEPTFIQDGTAIFPAERVIVEFPKKKDPVAIETSRLMTINNQGHYVAWEGDTKPIVELTYTEKDTKKQHNTTSLDTQPPLSLEVITNELKILKKSKRLDGYGRTAEERRLEENLLRSYHIHTARHILKARKEIEGRFKQLPGYTSIGFPHQELVVELSGPSHARVVIIDPKQTLFELRLSPQVRIYYTPEIDDYTEYRINGEDSRLWYRDVTVGGPFNQPIPAPLEKQVKLVNLLSEAA